jgi:hypothetical protein
MDEPAFDDADDLHDGSVTPEELAATVETLVRSDLTDSAPGAVLRAFEQGDAEARVGFAMAWNDAMDLNGLGDWIAEDPARQARAEEIAQRLTPPDPPEAACDEALARLRSFTAWHDYQYEMIVVPGYTPADAPMEHPLHDVAKRRLALAKDAADRAPFILVSGGNVHPPGTKCYEAVQMRDELVAMGVAADRILLDARARHTTTNLRNAGRLLLANGRDLALIVTVGGGIAGSDFFGQDFYLGHPWLSTFYLRCRNELGYEIGELVQVDEHQVSFVPSPFVTRIGFRDALDP